MTINFHFFRTQLSGLWTQIGFLAIAVLFNLCLVAQLLTVGLAVFYNYTWWSIHVWLVRGYSGLVILLLAGLFISSDLYSLGLTAIYLLSGKLPQKLDADS